MNLLSSIYRPIPEFKKFSWKGVWKQKIKESGEKLVPLSLVPENILVRPQYYLQNIKGALPECYTRNGNLNRLVNVAKKLPSGYKLLIFDAWRSEAVQLDIYDKYCKKLKKKMPEKEESKLKELTEVFVALPSNDPQTPSPHITGGSIDLTIVDDRGRMLDMGTGFDEMNKKTYTLYYEKLLVNGKKLSTREEKILNNRRLLYNIMSSEGFTNYPNEWWHFDYGNQVWAFMRNNGNPAIYGITLPSPLPKWEFN